MSDPLKALLNQGIHGILHAELVVRVPSPSEAAVTAVKRAAKGSKKRSEALVDLWLTLGDAGAAWSSEADAEVRTLLATPSAPERDSLVQKLKFDPRRLRFASELRAIAARRTDPAWAWAVESLGVLRDPAAAAVLMEHTAGQDTAFVVLAALVRLRDPIADLVFEPNHDHPEPRTRTFALWGSAALGDEDAIRALVALLDDPDRSTPTSYTPGQSVRAAQALCDVFGWPFEWGDAAVEATRARLAANSGG